MTVRGNSTFDCSLILVLVELASMGIFQIEQQDSKTKARAGFFETAHGRIQTPVFMPVGTQATVKSLTPKELDEIGAQIILNNTYHLYLRPGADLVQKLGGVHAFQSWDKPILTDSGGFQVFSLGLGKSGKREAQNGKKVRATIEGVGDIDLLARIDEDGVTFQSHIDGSVHRFTPEISIQTQHKLGADIILAFDECPPYPSTDEYTHAATDRTHRWAVRSLDEHTRLQSSQHQLLFGIVQGGISRSLRKESAKFIANLAVDGICIGGVSVGEPKPIMYETCEWVEPFLPEDKPRHLLGIGDIDDLFNCIERGMDMFDCVTPTRWARNGALLISPKSGGNAKNKFRLNIFNTQFRSDKAPIDKTCMCYTCQNFSRAYLRHLFVTNELTGYHLATYHNVYFLVHLVAQMRQAILDGQLLKLKDVWLG